MSVEQLEQSVLQLETEDRRRFLDWLREHEDQLLGESDPVVDTGWKQEVRRRVAEIEGGAVQAISSDEVSAKIRRIVGR